MTEPEVQIARRQALFRDVNERIAETSKNFNAEETEFVCECADPSCTERVEATLDEYERVRTVGTRFLVVPGHEDKRIERVVARPRPRFAIVEKFNKVVAKTVRRLNPRTQPT